LPNDTHMARTPDVISVRSPWPKISVITPSYNQARFLEETITSVLNQDYPNLEYIIIDGGSTDGSVDIIRKHEHQLAYWVSEPDNGQAHAINKGFRKATGEWVGFQNSDDCYLPGALFSLVRMGISKRAGVVYGDIVIIDEKSERVCDIRRTQASLLTELYIGIQIHNQSALMRRDLLDHVGYLREDLRFCFDYEYYTRLLSRGVRVQHVPVPLGAFRIHGASKTTLIRPVANLEHRAIAAEYTASHPLYRRIPHQAGVIAAQTEKLVRYALLGHWNVIHKKALGRSQFE